MNITEAKPVWNGNYAMGYNAFITRRKDFVSTGIRWFSRWDELPGLPPVSHTFIISGPNETIEAFANGVQRGTIQAYLADPNVALLVRRPKGYTPELGLSIVRAAAGHVGDRYNYMLLVAMAASNSLLCHGLDLLTKGWFSRTVDGWADSKRSEICSQLVAEADQAQPSLVGKGVLLRRPETIMPIDLIGSEPIYEPGIVELVT